MMEWNNDNDDKCVDEPSGKYKQSNFEYSKGKYIKYMY